MPAASKVNAVEVYDLSSMESYPYEKREKCVLHQEREFKTRIVALEPGGTRPECEMSSHVIFLVLNGAVKVRVDAEEAALREAQCLITEPATASMRTGVGVLLHIRLLQSSSTPSAPSAPFALDPQQ